MSEMKAHEYSLSCHSDASAETACGGAAGLGTSLTFCDKPPDHVNK